MEDKVDGQTVAENGSGEQEEPKKVKSYRIKENMTGKDFYKIQVDTSSALEQPFNIQRPDDEDVRKLCELCKIVEEGFCCPDHCCDVSTTITLFFRFSYFFNFFSFHQWDNCRCNSCAACKTRRNLQRKKKFEQEQNIKQNNYKAEDLHKYMYNVEKEPMHKIISEGNEEVQQIRRKKQMNWGDKKNGDGGQEAPAEMIKTGDEFIIKNYDVVYEEEQPDLRMLGGIRGIRALRVQRDYMPDVDQGNAGQGGNMFAKYEKKSKGKYIEESKGH